MHEHITPHLEVASKVLVIGCGNSQFSEQLWLNGYRHLLSIDYSETVIAQMRKKSIALHGGQAPEGLQYEVMDLHRLTLPDHSHDVIMDKACLDALVTDHSEAVFADVSSMIDETIRVLHPTKGKYVCVTLAQTNVLKLLLTKFAIGWDGVVTQAVSVESKASLSSFVFVFTRGTKNVPTTLTLDLDETDGMFDAKNRRKGMERDVSFVELGLEEPRRRHRAIRFGSLLKKSTTTTTTTTAAATANGSTNTEIQTVRLAAFEKVAARLDGARKMLYAQKELKELEFAGMFFPRNDCSTVTCHV